VDARSNARRIAKWTWRSALVLVALLTAISFFCRINYSIGGYDFEFAAGGLSREHYHHRRTPVPEGATLTATGGSNLLPWALVDSPGEAIGIPFWLVVIPLGLAYAGFCILVRHHPTVGHCPHCSYNLTGNQSGKCPECGTPPSTPAPQAT